MLLFVLIPTFLATYIAIGFFLAVAEREKRFPRWWYSGWGESGVGLWPWLITWPLLLLCLLGEAVGKWAGKLSSEFGGGGDL